MITSPDRSRRAAYYRKAAAIATFCTLSSIAAAQTTNKGVLAGLVRDSAGTGLANATITVINPKTGAEVQTGHTVFNGRFAISGLETGVTYQLKIAKFDYYTFVADSIVIPSTNVLRSEFVMHLDATAKLTRVTIKAPKKGSKLAKKFLEETEIAQAKVPSALDAIQKLRPIMLAPSHDICINNDSLSLYVDGIRRPVYNPTDQMGPRRLVTGPGNRQYYTTGRTNDEIVRDELAKIPAEDIWTVQYVSCDDYDNKIQKRNVIWLLSKRYKENSSNAKDARQQ